jgi:hypothetical protein
VDAALAAVDLAGWTPVRVYANRGEPVVEWALVDGPFADPFFEQTANHAMQQPFNAAFARRTPIAALEERQRNAPGLAPRGFIFHMSRCGSTLVAQTLDQLSATIVLSEPQPLDAILRLRAATPAVCEEKIVAWLRAMMSALGQSRDAEHRLFVKFNAWHVRELPLIARAFPGVPWIFTFREPRDVVRSQRRSPGAEVMDPALAGLDARDLHGLSPDEYGIRALAAFCDAALGAKFIGRGAFVDYADVRDAALSAVPAFFGISPTPVELARMRDAAFRDAKNPAAAFRQRPQEPLPADVERLIERWLDAPYAALRNAPRSVARR